MASLEQLQDLQTALDCQDRRVARTVTAAIADIIALSIQAQPGGINPGRPRSHRGRRSLTPTPPRRPWKIQVLPPAAPAP